MTDNDIAQKAANRTTVVSARLPRVLKDEAFAVFERYGLTLSDGIKALCIYVARTGEVPFPVVEKTVSKEDSANTSGRIPAELKPIVREAAYGRYKTTTSTLIWAFFEAVAEKKDFPFPIEPLLEEVRSTGYPQQADC